MPNASVTGCQNHHPLGFIRHPLEIMGVDRPDRTFPCHPLSPPDVVHDIVAKSPNAGPLAPVGVTLVGCEGGFSPDFLWENMFFVGSTYEIACETKVVLMGNQGGFHGNHFCCMGIRKLEKNAVVFSMKISASENLVDGQYMILSK